MLLIITIKIQNNQSITIQITEDPSSMQAINFYDINFQIYLALKRHLNLLITPKTTDDHLNAIMDALEFKVKRELQLNNISKYHTVAINT